MNDQNAIKTLSEIRKQYCDRFTASQVESIDFAIANIQSWDQVKDKLLLMLYKGSCDGSYQKGIRHSLITIDDVVTELVQSLQKEE